MVGATSVADAQQVGRSGMTKALDSAWTTIATFVPKLIGFILILIIGLIIAKFIAKALAKVLEKVGFDKAVERGGVKKVLAKSSMDASNIVGKLVYYTLVLFVLQLAFGVFGPNPISLLITSLIAFLPKIIVAIVIIVVAAAIAAAVKTLIEGTLGGLSYGKVLANIASLFILGLGVIAALNQVDVATTVTTPVLIAVLATMSGGIIVGAGGGLIKPRRPRTATAATGTSRHQLRPSPPSPRPTNPLAPAGSEQPLPPSTQRRESN